MYELYFFGLIKIMECLQGQNINNIHLRKSIYFVQNWQIKNR